MEGRDPRTYNRLHRRSASRSRFHDEAYPLASRLRMLCGIVALGSLGEGATLSFDEKKEILRNSVAAAQARGPVVAAIFSLVHGGGGRVGEVCKRSGMRRVDGAAPVCVPRQLA